MRQRLWMAVVCAAFLSVGLMPTAAQDAGPSPTPEYDPTCAVDLMEDYMSGWEYNHRESGGVIDVVAAAQVARGVHAAFAAAKIDCKNTFGGFKQALLRSMHSDYPAEDLARMLSFVDEAVGNVDYNDCAYSTASQFVRQVDWGDTPAIQVGRAISEIFRTVRGVIPNGKCDGTFLVIQEIISHIDDVPPDGSLVGTLYKIVGDATEGHYVSQYSCDYTLAKTFLEKVEWDGLTSEAIEKLVKETFTITYKISGDEGCDYDPALAITAMLLDDSYRFPPDASVIQNTYDAATGQYVPTPEATPLVN